MKVIHGTWIPETESNYIQEGAFYLWVETSCSKKSKSKSKQQIHPDHLKSPELDAFVRQELGIKDSESTIQQRISPRYFALPMANNKPLASIELSRYLESDIPDEYDDFQYWQVDCYQAVTEVKTSSYRTASAINIIKLLQDIHFLALYSAESMQLGADLLFWYHYTQAFKEVILKDRYIPTLQYRQLKKATKATKQKTQKSASFEIYPTWSIVDEHYEANIDRYREYMPPICTVGANSPSNEIEFFDGETLLRHFSEYLLNDIVTHTPSTAGFDKKVKDSILEYCLNQKSTHPLTSSSNLAEYKQWLPWQQKITRTQNNSSFHLCFQLHAAAPDNVDNWQIQFFNS